MITKVAKILSAVILKLHDTKNKYYYTNLTIVDILRGVSYKGIINYQGKLHTSTILVATFAITIRKNTLRF